MFNKMYTEAFQRNRDTHIHNKIIDIVTISCKLVTVAAYNLQRTDSMQSKYFIREYIGAKLMST